MRRRGETADSAPSLNSARAEAATGEEQEEAPQGELIPDYALPAQEKDRFDHEDYVDRLMAVVEHVSVDHASANVALFGARGSGKSGIANWLAARIDGDTRFHYSYFDAFKFARLPLLRNFIAHEPDRSPAPRARRTDTKAPRLPMPSGKLRESMADDLPR